uniref:Ig-like domain-containing protein n=1 Tax=Cyprinus carpio TaxID=7962 RepID=A0A8C1W3U1_CYPCA
MIYFYLCIIFGQSIQITIFLATLVCLAEDISVALVHVSWSVNVTEGVFTGSAEQQPDKKFKMSSYLSIESSEWDKDTQLTCEATAASKTTSKSIKKSDCRD